MFFCMEMKVMNEDNGNVFVTDGNVEYMDRQEARECLRDVGWLS